MHLLYDPAIPYLGTQEKENTCPHKDLYGNVYSKFFHNSPKLETSQMFITKE